MDENVDAKSSSVHNYEENDEINLIMAIIDSGISKNTLFEMLCLLPEKFRTVFNLYIIENYSHAEIASLLGISETTSQFRLLKAKQLLKKFIKRKSIGTEAIKVDPVDE